jgi:hypothetical protein
VREFLTNHQLPAPPRIERGTSQLEAVRLPSSNWMKEMSPKQGMKIGLLISGALALLILAGLIVFGVSSYDGYCISFEPPKRPCGILEFLIPYLLLLVVFSVIGKPILAIIFFFVIVTPPLIGYIVGRRNAGTAPRYKNQ